MRSTIRVYQSLNSVLTNKLINLFSVKYTKNHEWVDQDSSKKIVRVGITNYAQQQLGEIVHVQLPTVGRTVKSGASAMTIESVKMAADVYTPVTGKVVKVNQEAGQAPGSVNQAAEKTWLFEIEYTEQPTELLNATQYEKLTKEHH